MPKVNTIKRGGSRLYVHPGSAEKVPGVTSVLNMLPKPFLKFWASKVVAETAVENLGSVVSIAMNDPKGAIDYLKRSPDRFTANSADMGTEVHDLYERLAKGEDVNPRRLHPDLKVYFEHFQEFKAEFEPEFVYLEETVWSEKHEYAGSFDFMAWINDPDTEGERVLVIGDWKTTRSGVHEEVALQLAAYKHADYILRPDGEEIPIPEEISVGVVMHARPEGWQLVPARIDEEVFEVFQVLRKVYTWDKETQKTVLGDGVQKGAKKKGSRKATRTPKKAAEGEK